MGATIYDNLSDWPQFAVMQSSAISALFRNPIVTYAGDYRCDASILIVGGNRFILNPIPNRIALTAAVLLVLGEYADKYEERGTANEVILWAQINLIGSSQIDY